MYECEKCGDTHSEVHGMKDDPIIKCPKCKEECFRVIHPITAYVKGNCYKNKNDCKQQAVLSTLQDADPYANHRVPGEREDLVNKLKNAGKNKVTIPINGQKK